MIIREGLQLQGNICDYNRWLVLTTEGCDYNRRFVITTEGMLVQQVCLLDGSFVIARERFVITWQMFVIRWERFVITKEGL